MDDIRVGSAIRAVRLRRGLRQCDVAAAAGLSQSTVSLVELGRFETLTLGTIRAVGRPLDVWIHFESRWGGAELPRLLDERHAILVGLVVTELRRRGWEVRVEYSFNVRGERGSVDVLAWLSSARALLLVEVKTQIVDVQELLSTIDRKRRVVPIAVHAELGWRADLIGRVLVLPDETRARAAVSRHGNVFSVALPRRTIDVRRWCRQPAQPLAGIWFLRTTHPGNRVRPGGGATRVRLPSGGQLRSRPRSSPASKPPT
jgi:DNA-binding Xre family transcriptional regulator